MEHNWNQERHSTPITGTIFITKQAEKKGKQTLKGPIKWGPFKAVEEKGKSWWRHFWCGQNISSLGTEETTWSMHFMCAAAGEMLPHFNWRLLASNSWCSVSCQNYRSRLPQLHVDVLPFSRRSTSIRLGRRRPRRKPITPDTTSFSRQQVTLMI